MYIHVHVCKPTVTESSAQNNSRPLVNFQPNYQDDLAKQLIVGSNDLSIGFNKVEVSMLRVSYALLH